MPWINPSNFKFIGLIYDAMNKSIFLVWYFMWKNTELEKISLSQFDWHKFPKEEKFVIFEGQFLVLWKNIENISDSVLHRLGRTCEFSQIKCWSLLIKLWTIWLIRVFPKFAFVENWQEDYGLKKVGHCHGIKIFWFYNR